MSVSAEIIEDSISPTGRRLTTFLLHYPRFIHAELMTHRLFSRNTSSSRAIPVRRQLLNSVRDMAVPVEWGSNQPGMQAGEELSPLRKFIAKAVWYGMGYAAAAAAYILHLVGAHKQIANRVFEPWTHVTVVVSSTEWANFFALRDHPAADPTIQVLARLMQAEMKSSLPTPQEEGQWHLPFVRMQERRVFTLEQCKILSVARCASASYLSVDGFEMTLERAQRVYNKLDQKPLHASPFEHQATPSPDEALWGNFRGWAQNRKMMPEEAKW